MLDKLVADGTITQAQEDAIIQAMKDEPLRPTSRPRVAPVVAAFAVKVLEGMLQVSADKIGVSVDDLKAGAARAVSRSLTSPTLTR